MLLNNHGGIVDHEVSGGKTLIMCIGAYEMKRLGIAHKPMLVCLKENVHEVARTFKLAYPNAKVLYPSEADFSSRRRIKLFNEMKNNDWDAIILSHENFSKIPQSPEMQLKMWQKEIDEIQESLMVEKNQTGDALTKRELRGLEIRKRNLEVKLKNLQFIIQSRQDKVTDFSKIGVDHLFVDESHYFKNLMFTTRHNRVAGLGNPNGSQRAANIYMAIRTLQDRKGEDLQASFFSGTTISNSLTELYLLFKYLTPRKLESQNIRCFDAWAAVYAQKKTDYEFNVTGQIVPKERFRYFIKVPELANEYALITDYRTAHDIGIDRPELDIQFVNVPPTLEQERFSRNLIMFAKTADPKFIGRTALSDSERKAKMLLATNYAAKAALDMRMINPTKYHISNKIVECVCNLAKIYKEYDA